MRAMVLEKPASVSNEGPLRALEREDSAPGPGEIAIDVTACGVCRTDLQIASGDLAARTLPIIPGHQIVGRVAALGEGVTRVRSGDRVGVGWLAWACGRCEACQRGRENLCAEARFTGWDRDGGYATRTIADAEFVFPLAHELSDEAAAPLLCGGVIGYRALRVAGVEAGMRVGLYGFGASATIALQIARHWGCSAHVFTRSEKERERAMLMGAAWAGGIDSAPPKPLHAAVTFAPVGSVVVAALKAVGRGATVAINAIHLDGIPAFDYGDLWWERSIRSVANYTRQDAREFLAYATSIPVKTTYETHALASANAALTRVQDGTVRAAAVLTTGPLELTN